MILKTAPIRPSDNLLRFVQLMTDDTISTWRPPILSDPDPPPSPKFKERRPDLKRRARSKTQLEIQVSIEKVSGNSSPLAPSYACYACRRVPESQGNHRSAAETIARSRLLSSAIDASAPSFPSTFSRTATWSLGSSLPVCGLGRRLSLRA